MYRWGLDLGGTKIEGIVLDEQFEVLARHRIPTEAEEGYEHIVNQIVVLVDELRNMTGLEPSCIGLGTPGSIDRRTGLQKNSNTTQLIGKPLLADIQARLGVPVILTNDANCFAKAEATMGAAAEHHPDASVVFGVIMGTGVGGGIVINGRVHDGLHSIAGEWGHNVIQTDGPKCYCGKNGCVEKYIAGPALERYYADLSGFTRRLPEIVSLADQGVDKAAVATIDRLVEYFGRCISVIINVLDPDVIVLGGGVSNIDALYTRGVAAAQQYVFNGELHTPILRPTLGDSAGVYGAALLEPR